MNVRSRSRASARTTVTALAARAALAAFSLCVATAGGGLGPALALPGQTVDAFPAWVKATLDPATSISRSDTGETGETVFRVRTRSGRYDVSIETGSSDYAATIHHVTSETVLVTERSSAKAVGIRKDGSGPGFSAFAALSGGPVARDYELARPVATLAGIRFFRGARYGYSLPPGGAALTIRTFADLESDLKRRRACLRHDMAHCLSS